MGGGSSAIGTGNVFEVAGSLAMLSFPDDSCPTCRDGIGSCDARMNSVTGSGHAIAKCQRVLRSPKDSRAFER
jgi:hypothetical protein